MRARLLMCVALIALVASVVSAHGDKKHVTGTVEKINADSVVVKTTDGKSVEVKLAPSTVYVSRVGNVDKPASMSDLAVGSRVAIHATPKGEALEAEQIKFSPAHATAGPKSKP